MTDPNDSPDTMWVAEQDMIRRRKEAAARWPQLLDEIRQVPGFEEFALPLPMPRMHEAAIGGTVVALIITAHGCGALLLTEDDDDYIDLPRLTAQSAFDNANDFLAAVNPPHSAAVDPSTASRILGWLWDVAVEPVLAHIGYTAMPATDQDWPKVWWIPTGALSVLPLHAAGHHDDPPSTRRSTLDRVISSYTASIRSLANASRAENNAANVATLVVGINDAPGLPALWQAEREAIEVSHLLGEGPQLLLGSAATHQHVTSNLPKVAWVHFACHGRVNQTDPAQSFLALFDQPLRANELFDMPNPSTPHLAYLSACTTAIGSLGLLDESIHIASAFQLVGFPHVIATLWQVDDFVAADLAEAIYAAIHPDPLTWNSPAHALHHVVREYRTTYSDSPHLWAAHIHLGP